jgi:hypothetical protein
VLELGGLSLNPSFFGGKLHPGFDQRPHNCCNSSCVRHLQLLPHALPSLSLGVKSGLVVESPSSPPLPYIRVTFSSSPLPLQTGHSEKGDCAWSHWCKHGQKKMWPQTMGCFAKSSHILQEPSFLAALLPHPCCRRHPDFAPLLLLVQKSYECVGLLGPDYLICASSRLTMVC